MLLLSGAISKTHTLKSVSGLIDRDPRGQLERAADLSVALEWCRVIDELLITACVHEALLDEYFLRIDLNLVRGDADIAGIEHVLIRRATGGFSASSVPEWNRSVAFTAESERRRVTQT